MTEAYIERIATAVPDHSVHGPFVAFASKMLDDPRKRAVFERMADRSGIETRHSILAVDPERAGAGVNAADWYHRDVFPTTGERMRLFEQLAPALLHKALDGLNLTDAERGRVQHVIVTCCTGHYAPGLDFAIIDHLGLNPEVSRTMIGFMGCYAAMNGLRQARDIVRSRPDESVLLVNLEICSIHLQKTQNLNEMLAFLVFADGCAASLISNQPAGLALDSFRSLAIPGTRDLITWRIDDNGFLMHLSGQVPAAIEGLLREKAAQFPGLDQVSLWAIHPGGRTVLDAVERALALPADALAASRAVLRRYGNMSSGTVMFVLKELMQTATAGERGFALAFGPGLTAETMVFHAV